LTIEEREEIAIRHGRGEGIREIARALTRCPSVISREIRRNRSTRGYRAITADRRARERRRRPQPRKIEADPLLHARVRRDLRRGRTPRQIAGRLRLEAGHASVGVVEGSIPAGGATVSHEAIYTYIYALPKGELAGRGIMLPSGRTRRRRRTRDGRGARIVGMRSIHERPADAAGRKVPGHWEGDLIIGKDGKTAAITLVDRQTRFVTILSLPQGRRDADTVADALIDHVTGLPDLVRKSLTWDQGTEMGNHAALTLATELPVYFADPHSPWQRPTNENTNRIIREYLPKGTQIPDHQPYLTAIAEEINNRPRACLGYLTPQEAMQRLLLEGVAPTN
jgi:IS30 family transposase